MRLFNKIKKGESKVTPPKKIIRLETPVFAKDYGAVGIPTPYKDCNGIVKGWKIEKLKSYDELDVGRFYGLCHIEEV